MHARLSRVEGTPDKVEAMIKLVRERIVPEAKAFKGFKGGYWGVDRATGQGFVVTLFESEMDMKASEDAAQRTRSDAEREAGLRVTGVERFEVIAQA